MNTTKNVDSMVRRNCFGRSTFRSCNNCNMWWKCYFMIINQCCVPPELSICYVFLGSALISRNANASPMIDLGNLGKLHHVSSLTYINKRTVNYQKLATQNN